MPAGNQVTQIIFLVVIVGAFYFLLIRPQQQQQKKQAAMVASLEAGAEIMTVGGIYALIVEVKPDRLRVRVADGSEFEIAKRAVASIVEPASDDDDAGDGTGEGADDATASAEASSHDKQPSEAAPKGAEDDAADA